MARHVLLWCLARLAAFERRAREANPSAEPTRVALHDARTLTLTSTTALPFHAPTHLKSHCFRDELQNPVIILEDGRCTLLDRSHPYFVSTLGSLIQVLTMSLIFWP
jgi:hypothetical protein